MTFPEDMEDDEDWFFMTLPNGDKINIKWEDGTSIVDAFVNRKWLKKYIDSVDEWHLIVETDEWEFIDTWKVTWKDWKNGKDWIDWKDYILTNKDKKEIAREIVVPIVEKVIEKTETIKEVPIITNEIKEVARYETPKEIVKKIESLEWQDRLSAKSIKWLEEFMVEWPRAWATKLTSLTDTNIVNPDEWEILVYNKWRSQRENRAWWWGGTWGSIAGTLSDQTDLQTALNNKANNCVADLILSDYVFDWTEQNQTGYAVVTTGWDVEITIDPSLFDSTNGLYEFIFCKASPDSNTVTILADDISWETSYVLNNYNETVTVKLVSDTQIKVVATYIWKAVLTAYDISYDWPEANVWDMLNSIYGDYTSKQDTWDFLNEYDAFWKWLMNNQASWMLPTSWATTFGNLMRVRWPVTLSGASVNNSVDAINFVTTAVAGTIAFQRATALVIYTSKYRAYKRFGFTAITSASRMFTGFSSLFTLAAPTNIEPNTLTNSIWVCKLSTSDNLHLIHNDWAGIATTFDLWSNFIAATWFIYDLMIEKVGSTIRMCVQKIEIATRTITLSNIYTATSDIPAVNQSVVMYITNNTSASIVWLTDYWTLASVRM